MTPLRIAALTLLLLAPACARNNASTETRSAGTEILWDTWGIPHIYAADAPSLGRAFGWAQMHAHANLLLDLYARARGRSAEYWGGDENTENDRFVRTLGIPATAREWHAGQTPEFRRYIDAFAEGMNAWARANAASIPDSLEQVLPITGEDVLAHGMRVLQGTFVTGQSVFGQRRAWERRAGAAAPGAGEGPASNAWAVAPSRSASGGAMLLANPHLPWGDLFTWFEAQLVAPGIDVYGATLVGMPVVAIGFNDRLGWTHTVNTHDGSDLYELTLDRGGYLWNGDARAFQTRTDTLVVRLPDGSRRAEELVVRSSVHGPVIAERAGKALALRVVGLDRPRAAEQWWEMGRARNLAEFERALGMMQMPMFTVMYADADGHVMHLFGGLTPVRPRGDWGDWDYVVRGDSSSTLWTRVHGYAELPKVVDPPSGWLQNANDPPWTTTFPWALDAEKFPAYMAPRGMAFRPQRSAKLVAEPARMTLDEMIARKHDTRMELADRLLDDLIPAARERGGEGARAAAGVLERWDRNADAGSRGAVLFAAWWRELLRRSAGRSPFAEPWDRERPLATPDGLANPAVAVAALDSAATEVRRRHRALDVAWGDVYRLRIDSLDLPANGGTGGLGIFRVTEFGEMRDGRATALGGDSFVAAVSFGSPVRARALLTYGNASQPGSRHRTDQLPLYARQELRSVWRTRAEVEANAASRTKM